MQITVNKKTWQTTVSGATRLNYILIYLYISIYHYILFKYRPSKWPKHVDFNNKARSCSSFSHPIGSNSNPAQRLSANKEAEKWFKQKRHALSRRSSLPLFLWHTDLLGRSFRKEKDAADFLYHVDGASSCLNKSCCTHAGCWGSLNGPLTREQLPLLWRLCVLACDSPCPRSRLGKGSWPRCPRGRRRRCEDLLHSSPGSQSPWGHREIMKGNRTCAHNTLTTFAKNKSIGTLLDADFQHHYWHFN